MRTKVFLQGLNLLILSFLATGCNAAISDYVDEAKRDTPTDVRPVVPTPPPAVFGSMNYKITPGKMNSATTNSGAIKGVVTPTNKVLLMGPDMSMTVTINRASSTR